ncbi:hypothetical protein [Bacillus sp. MUM 13]|uniref:hypothetical protein n=1 Tax=Bacillus sp. MUM 13 TaxID=1678001 RepID=UPI0008F5CC0E|nr:hypothetical protein [Bacillus sp. MUM 13]OIK04559.1 hypothetical protein BIV59_22090 [Bacillus sp. MUM 13]
MHQRITEADDQELPAFENSEEASAYFKEKYGDDFILKSSKEINGEQIDVYVLVLDREAFRNGEEKWAKAHQEIIEESDFTSSFQSIGIGRNGEVYIAY